MSSPKLLPSEKTPDAAAASVPQPPPLPQANATPMQASSPLPPPSERIGPMNPYSNQQLLDAFVRLGHIFRPCHMFFYGSLMDPEVIQAILNLPELPTTRPATISGFQVKMWSIYPTLIPGNEKVSGVVWEVKKEEHFKRLQAYETAAYKWTWCEAILENDDKTVIENCRTFCWAGEPDSKELEDGSFDLAWYQRVLEPSVVKWRVAAS